MRLTWITWRDYKTAMRFLTNLKEPENSHETFSLTHEANLANFKGLQNSYEVLKGTTKLP